MINQKDNRTIFIKEKIDFRHFLERIKNALAEKRDK